LAPDRPPPSDHRDRHRRGLLHRARARDRRRRLRVARPTDPAGMSDALLEVKALTVSFRTEDGLVRAVDGVSLTVQPGEVVGIVGESGSGKSVSMLTVMRLINDPNAVFEGEVVYKGRNLMELSEQGMRGVRGAEIAMIFQDPLSSLNPVYKIGWQIEEQLHAHRKLTRPEG